MSQPIKPPSAFVRVVLRGPLPKWWALMCVWSTLLQTLASVALAFGVPVLVTVVPAALGLLGFVVTTVVFLRAPRIWS